MKKRILITGASGKNGKILIDNLGERYELVGLDQETCLDDGCLKVDISDYNKLYSVLEACGNIDVVIHMAADPRPEADWQSVLQNNIIGTRNIYECSRLLGVKKIIFASSNRVTSFAEKEWRDGDPFIKPSDQYRPDSDYAVSKIFGEALAREYFDLYGLQSICVRIGSVMKENNPINDTRRMRTWMSYADFINFIKSAIETKVKFGVYYGVSDNDGRFWDIKNVQSDLGFYPKDNSKLIK